MSTEQEQRGCLRLSLDYFVHYARTTVRRYKKLNLKGKLFIWGLIWFYISLGTFFLVVGPGRIAQFLYDVAQDISKMKFGWLIMSVVIVVVCFPPAIGQTTLVTLCGFAYGIKGILVAAGASIVGSAFVFVILRYLFAKRLRHWTSDNEKWEALKTVIKAKGLPLIILIRLSPFPPWVYANTLFASIESVQLWQFVTATACITPKWLLFVFIGSRLASLSDGEQRKEMDTQTMIINSCLAVGGLLTGLIASIVVYRLVKGHLRHLKGVPPEIDELAAEALDGTEEEPLLINLSSDSVNNPSEERHTSLVEV